MEPGKNEITPQVAKKPKQHSISQRFRLLKDKFLSKDPSVPSASWEAWKEIVIANRGAGIPEKLAPERFLVSDNLLDTFQEMLPVRYPGRIEDKNVTDAVRKALQGVEVARNLVVDESGKRLLVQNQNGGEPISTPETTGVRHEVSKGQIGTIHTHPDQGTELPTSADIFNLLYSDLNQELAFIVTTNFVTAFFRSDKTPAFSNPIIAKGYLEGMGKSKKRDMGQQTRVWRVPYSDLSELHILSYQARRGSNIFIRKDNAQ